MIQICTVGGYNEVGKNCTAIKVDDEVIIIDMGIHLEKYIEYTQDEDVVIDPDDLIKVGAIPNISVIKDWLKDVKAIIPTHAHLDHVGALPYLANKINAPILCTAYTAEVIKAITADEKIKLKNEIKVLNTNSTLKLTKNIKVEFVNTTHSTPQTVMVAIHTKYGIIIYANDFKFDNYPTLGKKPNYERLEELGKEGIIALIVDSLYAPKAIKTPSETVAKEMLRDVLIGTNSKGKAVIITTFSSHLARLNSIIEFGKLMKRKIVFLGRSLSKYVQAGENIKLINFSKNVELVKYRKEVSKKLKYLTQHREKYLIVVTGHQGEPKSVLSRIINNETDFRLMPEDHVIFSSTIIPVDINFENRKRMEDKLMQQKVRIFKDIHVSGHAAREDLRDLINLTKPKNIIPAHGNFNMESALAELCTEMGYKKNNIFLVKNGDFIELS